MKVFISQPMSGLIEEEILEQREAAIAEAKMTLGDDIEILETLERGLEVRQQGTRPKTRMVGHSGYLLFARKL